MQKKILSLFLAGSLIFTCGCGNNKKVVSNPNAINVDILQYKVEFKDQFEELADVYNEQNPDVHINVMSVGGGSDYNSVLKSKLASSNQPAVFNIGGLQDTKDYKSMLVDLSQTQAAQNALKGTLDGVSMDGKIYGLPYNVEGYGLIYNKDIFDKAGIEPNQIKTYGQLVEVTEKLDSMKEELGIEAVFAYPAKETWLTGQHSSNLFLAPEFGDVSKAFNAKTVEFKYSKAFKDYVDLQNKYSVQPVVSLDYSMQVEQLFAMDKVAMIQQGNWIYPALEDIDEDFAKNKVGLIPIPVEGLENDNLPVGVPYYWGINANKDKNVQEEAIKFLDWMYTSEEGKNMVLEEFKFAPAYSGFDTSKISDPLTKTVYNYLDSGKTTNWVFMGYPTDWAMGQLGTQIQKYLSGEIAWDDMLNYCRTKWESVRE